MSLLSYLYDNHRLVLGELCVRAPTDVYAATTFSNERMMHDDN